ncbi:MAG TPA: iron-sulfur cluster repair di-iron protein [Acidobacteriaceae bacterium]|nr:iron-sulfur cluster repair di-iron protein [Acidobacteriaceae bacterium]
MAITSETPVRDIAVEHPTTIPVLERFGIDYCCGGKHTLAEACAKRDVDLAPVLKELESQQRNTDAAEAHWLKAPLKQLTDHIVQKHHAFTREQIKLIADLMKKVEARHGADHPEFFEIGKVFAVTSSELTHHFFCEENILFPYIGKMEAGQQAALPPVFGSVEQPITRMMMDHDQAGEELRALRVLTNDYTPPTAACPTWRALYRALEDLERDLHQHIHLENNILFPRALVQARAPEINTGKA